MWEKKKETTKCDKSTIKCYVGIAEYNNEPSNVRKKI